MKYVSIISILLLAGQMSWARTKHQTTRYHKASSSQQDNDKVDIQNLENKYWAPKDTDFNVVQNRTYTKAKKIVLSLQYGPTINDGWSEGYDTAVTANYFFNERYGVQATYVSSDLSNKQSTDELITYGGGVWPDFGRMKSYYGIGFNYVPFYAKMSFIGKKILYFDMAITPTLGMTQYDQQTSNGPKHQSAFTYGVDLTQYFFLSDWFAIRADLKNQWYNEEVVRYHTSDGIQTGVKLRNQTNHTSIILLGVSFFF